MEKLLLAASMMFTNIASRHVKNDIDSISSVMMHEQLSRKVFWICLCFVATRDIVWSLFIGFIMAIVTELVDKTNPLFIMDDATARADAYYANKIKLFWT